MTNLNIAKLYLANNSNATAAQIDTAVTDGTALTAINALTTAQFVEAAYQAAFGRAADAEGLAYWSNEIDVNGMAKDDAFMTALNYGATVYVAPTAETPLVIGTETFTAATVSATDDVVVAAAKATAEAAASSASVGSVAAAVVDVVDTTTATAAAVVIDAADAAADAAAAAATEYNLSEDMAEASYADSATKVIVTLDGDDDATEGTNYDVTLSSFDDTVILDSYNNAVVDGGAGIDTINLLELSPGLGTADVNLAAGTSGAISPSGTGVTSLVHFENVIASDDGGRIVGTVGTNVITLGEGTDDISTSGGNDTIVATDDTFLSGTDTLDGGSGTDTFSITGEDALTFAAADFTGIENIIISGIDDDDVVITGASLFNDATAAASITAGIVGGVQNITIEEGGDNTMTLNSAASTNLVGATFTGLDHGAINGLTITSVTNTAIDATSLSNIKLVTGVAAGSSDIQLVGAGEFDLSKTVFAGTIVTLDGTAAEETVVLGNNIGTLTEISLANGDDTISFANTVVGDITGLTTLGAETLDFGTAEYVSINDGATEGTFSEVIGTAGTSDTLVIAEAGNITADLSGTSISGIEVVVLDNGGAAATSDLTIKAATLSSGMLVQGDSGVDTVILGGAGVNLDGVTLEAIEILDLNTQNLSANTTTLSSVAIQNAGATISKLTITDNAAFTLDSDAVALTAAVTVTATADADDITLTDINDGGIAFILNTGDADDSVTLGAGNTLDGALTNINLQAGDDTVNLAGNIADFAGGGVTNTLDGGTGTDTVTFTGDIISTDFLLGEIAAFETVAYQNATINAVSFVLGAGDAAFDTVDFSADTNASGINTINLSAYAVADTSVIGSVGMDVITTSVSSDTVDAAAGNDNVVVTGGTASAETYSIDLGAGNDTLTLGTAAATIDATIVVNDWVTAEDTINLATEGSTLATFIDQTVAQAAVDIAVPSTLAEAATAAFSTLDAAAVGVASTVFQFDGNTYVGLSGGTNNAYTAAEDTLITLTGTHDLTVADFVF